MADPKTKEEVLEVLRKFFREAGSISETRGLWNILAALRGPDSMNEWEKATFTVPVRRSFLGIDKNDSHRFVESLSNGTGVVLDSHVGQRVRNLVTRRNSSFHFYGHAIEAMRSLGEERDTLPYSIPLTLVDVEIAWKNFKGDHRFGHNLIAVEFSVIDDELVAKVPWQSEGSRNWMWTGTGWDLIPRTTFAEMEHAQACYDKYGRPETWTR